MGKKLPNAFGLYDMHGNIYEYCQDWYREDFYSLPEATAPDPVCTEPISLDRVFRGGYIGSPAEVCRSAWRGGTYYLEGEVYIGFLVVLPVSP